MSELLLIPFGLRLSDQRFVDVSEVKKGRKCNCICPSCKTPLIARQGEINEWHFAHVSKGVSGSTQNECEYSFWVSVTLMAKQIIATAKFIYLPALTLYASDRKEVKITDEKEVIINHVEIEQKLNSIPADAVLRIGGHVIAVIFSTPNKNLENIAFNSDDFDKVGILEISLSNAHQWLFDSNN